MKTCIVAVVASFCALFAGCAPQVATPPASAPAVQTPPTPEQMQAAFEAGSRPGPQHANLKKLSGTWATDVKWWMDPNGKPETSKGKSVNIPILGGRFIREDYSGTMMGQQFQGVGMLGYDNISKEYTSFLDGFDVHRHDGRDRQL